ncbi:MAG: DNA polymerase III subunit epsilon [Proteobacteria bacterium]|nr:DNA polymerase III subunit epsilon [Pseudomonadota bacterium]
MREIVLDTETTGLNPKNGHRIIEIGCIELHNFIPTGRVYHTYINPERDVPPEASAISGLTTDFLKPYPLFHQVVNDFLGFIENAPLVIHNAAFDIGFLNMELERLGMPFLPVERAIDTITIARKKFPGAPANLDALCRRFNIDLRERTKHGALLDAKLLATVYLELRGGRQKSLLLDVTKRKEFSRRKPFRPARPHNVPEEELFEHQQFLKKIKKSS